MTDSVRCRACSHCWSETGKARNCPKCGVEERPKCPICSRRLVPGWSSRDGDTAMFRCSKCVMRWRRDKMDEPLCVDSHTKGLGCFLVWDVEEL
jgi:hypothetical protein